jgi:hypothetical protein
MFASTSSCYPKIYDMTMLALASYMNILIEWKHPVYPDIILILAPCKSLYVTLMSVYISIITISHLHVL